MKVMIDNLDNLNINISINKDIIIITTMICMVIYNTICRKLR